MKLYLNKPCSSNCGSYFIRHSDVGVVWLEDNDGREHYVGTFDDAYEVVYQIDKRMLTEAGMLYIQRIGDKKTIRRFWHNISKIKAKE